MPAARGDGVRRWDIADIGAVVIPEALAAMGAGGRVPPRFIIRVTSSGVGVDAVWAVRRLEGTACLTCVARHAFGVLV